MKLRTVEAGKGLAKVKFAVMGAVIGSRAPDVIRVMLYRPELFGKTFIRAVDRVVRGASDWTSGERELFAAFVSNLNDCEFCRASHAAVANRAFGEAVVTQVFRNWRTASVSPQVRAALGYLEKLTLHPTSLTTGDVDALREAGISDAGAETLVVICSLFCVVNRIADSLGFEVPSASEFARMAVVLSKVGYKA